MKSIRGELSAAKALAASALGAAGDRSQVTAGAASAMFTAHATPSHATSRLPADSSRAATPASTAGAARLREELQREKMRVLELIDERDVEHEQLSAAHKAAIDQLQAQYAADSTAQAQQFAAQLEKVGVVCPGCIPALHHIRR